MVQHVTRPPLVRGQWYPMSWDEFVAWSPEGKTEWVDGEGIADVSNSIRHAMMVAFWAGLLRLHVQVFNLGVVFDSTVLMRLPTRPSGRMPDVMVVLADRQDRLLEQWLQGPADFVAEFVSEDDPNRDMVVKLQEFEREGVPEYHWVDARSGRRDFRFHRRGDNGQYDLVEPDAEGRYHSEVLPGFWFDPAWFWEDPLPEIEHLMHRMAPRAYRAFMARIFAEAVAVTEED